MKPMKHKLKCIVAFLFVGVVMTSSVSAHYQPVDDPRPEFHTSGWAKPEVDRAYEMGLIRHVFHSDPMDEPISREEFCAVALRFVETQAQVDVLPDIINYERAERNEDGKCVPVFRDMPQDN